MSQKMRKKNKYKMTFSYLTPLYQWLLNPEDAFHTMYIDGVKLRNF